MTNPEISKELSMLETGPKPLTASEIEFNARRLKNNEIVANKLKSTFSQMGIFRVLHEHADYPFAPQPDSDPFWAPELLKFDPQQYTIQTTRYGNLGVYGVKEGMSAAKPEMIIEAKDVRSVEGITVISTGIVRSSGFIFPENLPPYPLGGDKKISPEELEQMLLIAGKKDKPQAYYHRLRGFAKVNTIFAGKKACLIPFGVEYSGVGDYMLADAVVVDLTKRQLLPRVFYNLDPKKPV